MGNIEFANQRYLLKEFLNKWSLKKIENMEINEYVSKDKDGFQYDIEYKTRALGSIKGTRASKYGLYKIKNKNKFVWRKPLGKSKNTAFINLKNNILVPLIKNVKKGNFELIEKTNSISRLVKCKIAFIYQNHKTIKILPIYTTKPLQHHLKTKEESILKLYEIAIKKENIKTIDDALFFAKKVFKDKKNSNKEQFCAKNAEYSSSKITKKRSTPSKASIFGKNEYSDTHSKIQKQLTKILIEEGYTVDSEAKIKGLNYRIDLVARKDSKKNYYEVKPYEKAKDCIREALGQLLEYHYRGKPEDYNFANNLIIVGPSEPTIIDEIFLEKLRNKHKIPISYSQIDID